MIEQRYGQVRSPYPSLQRESFRDLLGTLAVQTSDLVRDEVALLGREYYEKGKILRPALILLAVGAFFAMLAAIALCAAIVLVIGQFINTWLSAAVTGGILGAVAAAMLWYSLSRLRRTSLKPEQTIRSLEENKEWLKEIT
jgi:uncharacterized membrane protein YqjE